LREARQLAKNILAVVRGAAPQPFVYSSKGTLAALGHYKGAGRVYRFNIHGFLAWWVWRTYYVSRMPRWSRRMRIIIDWTVALFFKNDVVQLDQVRGNAVAGPVDRPAEAIPAREEREPARQTA
jgi:NADH dehydrogenase